MPKISVNILTKNRPELLKKALYSVRAQSYSDIEVIVISDGSINQEVEKGLNKELMEAGLNIFFTFHNQSLGIVASRNEALNLSKGEYIAILDDDDEWIDPDKLKKQVEFLNSHPEHILVGGGIAKNGGKKFRPENDSQIRNSMLFRNNFFTSTVMFRRENALTAGGFIKNGDDLSEDYDLWLRLGHKPNKMHNFQQVFAAYRVPNYNKDKFKAFLNKQLSLITREKKNYPNYWLAALLLKLRLFL